MEKTLMGQLRIVAAVIAAAALTGCGSWFEPQKDDVIDPSQLNSPAALATLRDGARSDFAAAFAGNYDASLEGIVLTSGLIADEFDNADTYPTRTEMDRRTMNVLGQNSSLLDLYRLMHRARASLDNIAARTRQLTPDNVDAIAELQALSGVMHLSFAENFCSGVPLSSVDSTGQLVYGPQKSTTELYDIADAKFDSAASLGADQAYTNLARLGKARVLLDRGQLAAAAVAASAVPTDFRYATTHSGTNNRTTNAIHAFHYLGFRWSVGAGAGAASPFVVNFAEASDPRLAIDADPSLERFDGEGQLYAPRMFGARSSPTAVATGIEARLIEAEAQLAANDASWLTTLNNLRATVPGLTPLSDPGTRDGRLQLLFQERGFWLFGQALRLSDIRRLIRQYGFTQDQVLPTGPYLKGGDYGTDVNIPIPFGERNNPSVIVGSAGVCLDRNP